MPVINRLASVRVLPLGSYSGSHLLGPVNIADDVTSVLFNVQRCTTATPTIWPNSSTILTITPEVSQDGGATWDEAGKSVAPGGILIIRGSELAFGLSGGSLPLPLNGITRQYRVTIDIQNGPLFSTATVEVT